MASRKKEAAGTAPAVATNQTAQAASAPAGGAGDEQSSQSGAEQGDGAAALVILGQQPGQIAAALSAPTLGTGAPEGGVVSEGGLLPDGYPESIEMGGHTVMVQARSARGRWRIGRHFTTEPSQVVIDELTEDEVGRLLADPELIVSLDD